MKKPRILFYDVENTPAEGYFWPGRMYDTSIIEVKKDWELLSVSWRWAGHKNTHFCSREGEKTDRKVAQKLFDLFSKADLIVAHNGNKSDYRKAVTRFAFHGMGLPKINSSVDTFITIKDNYILNSYSLAYACKYFKLGEKMKGGGFEIWKGCAANDRKSWRHMEKYNKWDSVLAERLYEFLKHQGHIRNHPTLQRIVDPTLIPKLGVCPHCGSTNAIKRGYRATASRLYQQWRCQESECKSWFNTAVARGGKKR